MAYLQRGDDLKKFKFIITIMKTKLLDFSVLKEEISQNNVLKMAALIAFMELRFQICYSGNRAQKMYADLFADIKQNTN